MTTKPSALRHGLTALCILTAGAVASGAAAASEPDPATGVRSVVVRYYDSSLSREQGSRTVYSRLQAAARTVCGRLDLRDAVAGRAWQRCYRTALHNAVVELDSARVTALHAVDVGRHFR